ncbi:unnamed protein product [Prorocentrum cordatum]|uniref:Uncharacterized protein n=1 Tax=Prorocentrum cordatum TaxID=2364126 RepID=A0ABN9PCK6_9DINO|nr:unnamed protein product [Polarella glacialis]
MAAGGRPRAQAAFCTRWRRGRLVLLAAAALHGFGGGPGGLRRQECVVIQVWNCLATQPVPCRRSPSLLDAPVPPACRPGKPVAAVEVRAGGAAWLQLVGGRRLFVPRAHAVTGAPLFEPAAAVDAGGAAAGRVLAAAGGPRAAGAAGGRSRVPGRGVGLGGLRQGRGPGGR